MNGVLLVDLMGIKSVNRVDESSPSYDSVMTNQFLKKNETLDAPFFLFKDSKQRDFFLGVCGSLFFTLSFVSELTYSPQIC